MKRQGLSAFEPNDSLIEAYARVVEFTDNHAVLRAEQQSACHSCAAAKGCGVSSLSKIFAKNTFLFETIDIAKPRIGDWYRIGLPSDVVLKMAAITYLTPIFCMIVAAICVSEIGAGDGAVALASFAGLVVGFMGARWLVDAGKLNRLAHPIILGPTSFSSNTTETCHVSR